MRPFANDPHFEDITHIDRKYLKNRIERDHAAMKQLPGHRLNFECLRSSKATLRGLGTMRTIKNGHIHNKPQQATRGPRRDQLGERNPLRRSSRAMTRSPPATINVPHDQLHMRIVGVQAIQRDSIQPHTGNGFHPARSGTCIIHVTPAHKTALSLRLARARSSLGGCDLYGFKLWASAPMRDRAPFKAIAELFG